MFIAKKTCTINFHIMHNNFHAMHNNLIKEYYNAALAGSITGEHHLMCITVCVELDHSNGYGCYSPTIDFLIEFHEVKSTVR